MRLTESPATGAAAAVPREQRLRLSRRNLPLLMLVARESVTSFFRPIFNEFGVTEQQWRIIRLLYEAGELTLTQVADRTFIVGPSLSGIVRRMIQAKLLVKRADPEDSRSSYVSLTRQARAKFEAMVPHVEEAYRDLESRAGKADINAIYVLLDRVLGNIGRRSG